MADREAEVLVIGDGPAGLSAALFLAKSGVDVQVYGENDTGTHKSLLRNYLGIREVKGTDFMAVARQQAEEQGAKLHDGTVGAIAGHADGFQVGTSDGDTWSARFVVVATGKGAGLARELGAEMDEERLRVDHDGRTTVANLYAAGSVVRGRKSQVAISVGDGAAVALDILSREKGKPFHDWDVP